MLTNSDSHAGRRHCVSNRQCDRDSGTNRCIERNQDVDLQYSGGLARRSTRIFDRRFDASDQNLHRKQGRVACALRDAAGDARRRGDAVTRGEDLNFRAARCPTPEAGIVKIDGAEQASGTSQGADCCPLEITWMVALPLVAASNGTMALNWAGEI